MPKFAAEAVDDAAPTERAPSVGAAAVPARMRGMALTPLWWRDDERENAVRRNIGTD